MHRFALLLALNACRPDDKPDTLGSPDDTGPASVDTDSGTDSDTDSDTDNGRTGAAGHGRGDG